MSKNTVKGRLNRESNEVPNTIPGYNPQFFDENGYATDISPRNPLPTADYGMTEGGLWIPKRVSDDGAQHTQLTGSNVVKEHIGVYKNVRNRVRLAPSTQKVVFEYMGDCKLLSYHQFLAINKKDVFFSIEFYNGTNWVSVLSIYGAASNTGVDQINQTRLTEHNGIIGKDDTGVEFFLLKEVKAKGFRITNLNNSEEEENWFSATCSWEEL